MSEQTRVGEHHFLSQPIHTSIGAQGTHAVMGPPALEQATDPLAAATLAPDLAPVATDGAEVAGRLREQQVAAAFDARRVVERFRARGRVAERRLGEQRRHQPIRGLLR